MGIVRVPMLVWCGDLVGVGRCFCILLAVFPSLASLLICFVSNLSIGGRSLHGLVWLWDCTIGHVACVITWYLGSVLITSFDALSM